MASNDELKFKVTATDNASAIIDDVAEKAEKLEKLEPEVQITADAGKAEDDVKDISERLKALPDDVQEIVLKADASKAEKEIKQAEASLRNFQKLSDEQVEVLLTTRDEAKQRLEDTKTKIDELNAKRVDIDTVPAEDGLRRVGVEGDKSRSVLANLVGNSAQDLGALGGVAGTAGVGLGQLAEYAAEGDIKLGGMAGAVIGVTAAIAIGTLAYQAYNAKQQETAKRTAEASAAMLEQLGILKKLDEAAGVGSESFESFGDALSAAIIDSMDEEAVLKVTGALGDLGLTVKDLGPTLLDIERNSKGALEQLARNANIPDDLAEAFARAVDSTEDFAAARQKLVDANVSLDDIAKYEAEIKALEQLNDQQQNYDGETIAKQQLSVAAGTDEATRALVASAIATNTDKDGKTDWLAAADSFNAKQAEATAAVTAYETAQRLATEASSAATNTLAQEAEAEAAARDAANEHANAIYGVIDARHAAVDAEFAAKDASDKYAETLATLDQKLTDAGDNERERNKVLRDAEKDAFATADANVRLAEEMAKATGRTVSQTEKQDIWNQSMLDNAATANGPLRDAILGHIASINQIPPEKVSEIAALIADGKLAEAKAKLEEASKTRDALIVADAETSQAERDLNYAARNRDAYITAHGRIGAGFNASGTNNWRGGSTVVGENGPEVVDLPAGSVIHPANRTEDLTRGGVTNITNNYITQNQAPMTAREQRRLERVAQRRGFR